MILLARLGSAVGGAIAGAACALIGIAVSYLLGDVAVTVLVLGTVSSAVTGAIGGWSGRFVLTGRVARGSWASPDLVRDCNL